MIKVSITDLTIILSPVSESAFRVGRVDSVKRDDRTRGLIRRVRRVVKRRGVAEKRSVLVVNTKRRSIRINVLKPSIRAVSNFFV